MSGRAVRRFGIIEIVNVFSASTCVLLKLLLGCDGVPDRKRVPRSIDIVLNHVTQPLDTIFELSHPMQTLSYPSSSQVL